MATSTKRKTTKNDKYRRTISEELFDQWRKLARKNDVQAIAKALNISVPTITKALVYGFVHQQEIVDGITKFFADRLLAEKDKAKELKELQKDLN